MRAARATTWVAGTLGLVALGYAGLVIAGWRRYGHPAEPADDERDVMLDRFMPDYEAVERHHCRVAAPAAITLAAAKAGDMRSSALVRTIFRIRELVLGADAQKASRPTGLVAETTALGWVILADEPGREVVLGAVTQPWRPAPTFRSVPPEEFLAFNEPGYVKILWNLRADPIHSSASLFRTETRVTTTDAEARARFRWYWARFSPGIALIRTVLLGGVKRDAERLARGAV